MPRWPLAVLAALVLAVPAASAARGPCSTGALDPAGTRACSVLASNPVPATPAPKRAHTNWPARVSASVLLVVALVLLYWRRRQPATSRGGRKGRGRE